MANLRLVRHSIQKLQSVLWVQKRLGFVLALFLGFSMSSQVFAQDARFGVEQFEPLPNQGTNILNVGTSDVIRHLSPSVGLFFHFQKDPLQLVNRLDLSDIQQRVIDYQLKGEVWASLGLWDYVDVSVVMPLVLYQEGGALDVPTNTGANSSNPFDAFTTGDLRLVPKVKILDAPNFGGFGLAVMVPISFPTGDKNSFNSEGRVRFEPRLVLDYRLENAFKVALNLAYQPRKNQSLLNFETADAFKWGLGVEVPLVERLAFIGTAFGAVAVDADVDLTEGRTMPIEALAGVQWEFVDDWIANIGGGAGLTNAVGSPQYRLFTSIGYTPMRRAEEESEPLDSDGDGIIDELDACPFAPEDFDGFEDEDGCPDPDNDGDGIPDAEDRCPNEAEDLDGFEDGDGCPDPDNDQDGILDTDDLCIYDAETFNDFEDEDGCPDIKPPPRAVLTDKAIEILERVYFDFDKSTIQRVSYALLDEVIDILKRNPQVTKVRIEGHTDNYGSRAYNMGLSKRRAKEVMQYLVKGGIDESRLLSEGYGFDFPIATNSTDEGRDKNRRVEFNILEINGEAVKDQVIRSR